MTRDESARLNRFEVKLDAALQWQANFAKSTEHRLTALETARATVYRMWLGVAAVAGGVGAMGGWLLGAIKG